MNHIDFDSTFKECKSQIDSAAELLTKKNILNLEKEVDEDGKYETIDNLEKCVNKMLVFGGVTKEDVFNNISKILDQIQLGKYELSFSAYSSLQHL